MEPFIKLYYYLSNIHFYNIRNCLKYKNLSKMEELDQRYHAAKTNFSDIYEHIETIHRYSQQCSSIVELGTRSCVSIWAELKALAEKKSDNPSEGVKLIGVDLERSDNISEVERLARDVNVDFKFIKGNDLEVDLGRQVDMVFIDSWHVYGQLKRELAKYGPLTNKYILMHDTTIDEHVGETVRESQVHGWSVAEHSKSSGFPWIEVFVGLWPAVLEFLENNPDWILEKRYTNCNGLTILKRVPMETETAIEIRKRGVKHIFDKSDEFVNNFLRTNFPTWEEETFDIFNKVKNAEKVAIDIGAWVGTTSIWLSKHFKKVIAMEPDVKSLDMLRKNLDLSHCDNVEICDQAISNSEKEIFFGGIYGSLNTSMSQLKTEKLHKSDYKVKTITLNQVLKKYKLDPKQIGFIKCDIEGGEEAICKELITFCHKYEIELFLSFHKDWWKDQNISRFGSVFSLMKAYDKNLVVENVSEFITKNPFFEFIFKTPEEKGHSISMNIIREHISLYTYWLHLEDDFYFFDNKPFISVAKTILSDLHIQQVLFNRNYAEDITEPQLDLVGSECLMSVHGHRYRKHIYYPRDSDDYNKYFNEHPGAGSVYWPHYSFRASLSLVKSILSLGPYDNKGFFEMEFSNRYYQAGFRSGFIDGIFYEHIGKKTYETGDNSYTLNGVNQY